mmetsp:Transcript_35954/g.66032  ORF Transcript_35954/g.66032 Transcript_35954/m.66032 type:complete len:591 (-) Transcript_35954:76-1848(-)
MVLSEKWVVSDEDLLQAVEAIRSGKSPQGASGRRQPLAGEEQKRSATATPRQVRGIPQLGLPKLPEGGAPQGRGNSAPSSARSPRSLPRRWIPHTALSMLHRTDTIACSSTGHRCIGAPSNHIKIYLEIPAVATLMHLWVDPDFPIQPPEDEEHGFAGAKATACLAPAKTLTNLMTSTTTMNVSKISSLPDEEDATPQCLQHVIQKYTGLQPWEQALRFRNTTRLFRIPGATLRSCDIFHGSTVQLSVLSGAERDVAVVLRSLREEMQDEFPMYSFDVHVLSKLKEPLVKSHLGYEKAMDRIRQQESAAILDSIKNLDSEQVCEGVLRKLTGIPRGKTADELLHPQSDVGTLVAAAGEAQDVLRNIFAEKSSWQPMENHPSFHETLGSDLADYILDPGIKSQQRMYEKVMTKYMKQYGSAAYARCHDISRFSLQYDTCSRLLTGLKTLKRRFEVVKVENRFAEPTAMGWRDITVLLKVPLKDKSYHIAELQLTHRVLAKARGSLHQYWKMLRSILPDVCKVGPEDMHRVQCLILSRLQSKSKSPGDAHMIQWALRNSAAGSAWISPRWQHKERPHLFEEFSVRGNQHTLF